jgi:hypothetical protein
MSLTLECNERQSIVALEDLGLQAFLVVSNDINSYYSRMLKCDCASSPQTHGFWDPLGTSRADSSENDTYIRVFASIHHRCTTRHNQIFLPRYRKLSCSRSGPQIAYSNFKAISLFTPDILKTRKHVLLSEPVHLQEAKGSRI